jgi:tetratricopeptide (TPR) repeat protein
MKRFGLPFALAVGVLSWAGCASTPPGLPLTGDPMVDGPNYIQNGPPRDRVMWEYRTALAALERGQYDTAKQYLDEAISRLDNIYGKDADASKARGLFSAEAKKGFIGEPYERCMAYYYRGIIYWRDGEPDNARACFRTAEFIDSYYRNGVPTVIDPDVLWACTTCRACEEQCPVMITHLQKIVPMRRHLVMMRGEFPAELAKPFEGMEVNGNPWNLARSDRSIEVDLRAGKRRQALDVEQVLDREGHARQWPERLA